MDFDVVAKFSVDIILSVLQNVKTTSTKISVNDFKAIFSKYPLINTDVCFLPFICDKFFNKDPFPIDFFISIDKNAEIEGQILDDHFYYKVGKMRIEVFKDENSSKILLMDFNIIDIVLNWTSNMDDNFNFDFKADFKFMKSEIN